LLIPCFRTLLSGKLKLGYEAFLARIVFVSIKLWARSLKLCYPYMSTPNEKGHPVLKPPILYLCKHRMPHPCILVAWDQQPDAFESGVHTSVVQYKDYLQYSPRSHVDYVKRMRRAFATVPRT